MNEQKIAKIMALVHSYAKVLAQGAACKVAGFDVTEEVAEAKASRATIESALRAAVPEVPEGWRIVAASDGDIRMYGPRGMFAGANETWLVKSVPDGFYGFLHRFLTSMLEAPPQQAPQADHPEDVLGMVQPVQPSEKCPDPAGCAREGCNQNLDGAMCDRWSEQPAQQAGAVLKPEPVASEREAFEAWARSVGKTDRDLQKGGFFNDGAYSWRTEQQMFDAWKARAEFYTHPLQSEQVRKQLSIAEVEAILARWSYELHGDRARFIVRETECAHGIAAIQAEVKP
jgi:hypothetical protein